MKILLVDDASQKLGMVKKVLKKSDIDEKDVDWELDLNGARKQLIKNFYDLLILDLNIPQSIGDNVQRNEGMNFVDEIIETDSYKKPANIIALTAYNDLEKEFLSDTKKAGFIVLKYDECCEEWQERLSSFIDYQLLRESQKTFKDNYPECDIAIITAVPVETIAVSNLSNQWKPIHIENDPITYNIGIIEGENKEKFSIVRAQQLEMGMTAASSLTTKLIYNFHPKYLIMTGIAGGTSCKKNSYGDIIIASEVWNYCSGKYIDKENKSGKIINAFEPDPRHICIGDMLLGKITGKDFSSILKKIQSEWIKEKPDCDLNLEIGPIACGAYVLASSQAVKTKVLSRERKTKGLDMESYGLYYAANSIENGKTIFLCIKSISDFANKEKNDDYQPYAAYTSTEFARQIIINHII
jgi:nucleoside phosphorylase/CheY-like chemotaxis protein